MNPRLPEEAIALADAARQAFTALGAVDLARHAELDPTVRADRVAPALDALGIDDLDPRADGLTLAAAAALCEQAGRVALPYPVASALVRDPAGRPTAVVPDGVARVDHGELFPEWRTVRLDGTSSVGRPEGSRLGTRLGPFVTDLTTDDAPSDAPDDATSDDDATADGGTARSGQVRLDLDALLVLTLGAWSVLGTVDRAVELAVDHVNGRVQFGKPIAAFQAVQFQLADAAVAVAGLRELAGFTLWRIEVAPDGATADVLALRVQALEVARAVLRTAQQLHGAAGVCDEYDVSILTRMVQPSLRLPSGVESTVAALARTIELDGFEGLFPHGAAAAGAGPSTREARETREASEATGEARG